MGIEHEGERDGLVLELLSGPIQGKMNMLVEERAGDRGGWGQGYGTAQPEQADGIKELERGGEQGEEGCT